MCAEGRCVYSGATEMISPHDLPVQGNVSFTECGISFYVHRNVPCRMSPKDRTRKEELVKMWKEVPPYISNLWNGLSTTGE